MNLEGLDSLSEAVTEDEEPSYMDLLYYLFWKRGIGLEEFNRTPIPYIQGICRTYYYIKEKEVKDTKRQNRKR